VLFVGVAVMLALDLWAYRGERPSRRTTLVWTVVWIAAGLAFGGLVWGMLGVQAAEEYYAAYAMEKGLSLDNIFLFYVIFGNLRIPERLQHKVLFWGILGAVVFRGLFVFLGVAAIERWDWMTYVFGAILLYAAWHALRQDPARQGGSRIVDWLARHVPVAPARDSGALLVRRNGGWAVTPLLLALVAIELTDVMFAIDSVPAALAITRDHFVVYSSNILAVLGLRALYLYLAASIPGLPYLHYGLAAVLAFAALKILTEEWIHVPPLVSIGVIAALIGSAVWASLRAVRKEGV
jgi:tellurite resistance protein TerC